LESPCWPKRWPKLCIRFVPGMVMEDTGCDAWFNDDKSDIDDDGPDAWPPLPATASSIVGCNDEDLGIISNRSALKRTLEQFPLPAPMKRHASAEDHNTSRSGGNEPAPVSVVSDCYRSPTDVPVDTPTLWRTTSNSSWSDDGGPTHDTGRRWRRGLGTSDREDIQQWCHCSRVGCNVPGTPIVPCKTPFEGPLADRAYEAGLMIDKDWFGKEDLLSHCSKQGTPVGFVVDLVNTDKYYAGFSEAVDGVEYQKVRIAGRTVPEWSLVEEVFDAIDHFVARRPGEFVAVHCTHGVNRTGFLVCAYLMTRGHLRQRAKAVAAFEKARGSRIDKEYLLEALLALEEGRYGP